MRGARWALEVARLKAEQDEAEAEAKRQAKARSLATKAYASIRLPSSPASGQRSSGALARVESAARTLLARRACISFCIYCFCNEYGYSG